MSGASAVNCSHEQKQVSDHHHLKLYLMYIMFFLASALFFISGLAALPTKPKPPSIPTPKGGDMRIMQRRDDGTFFIERYHAHPEWEYWFPRSSFKTEEEARAFIALYSYCGNSVEITQPTPSEPKP